MQRQNVTIKDIAKYLGISKSTVSRALADKYDVNSETRERILKACKKLNYRPNPHAISLKSKTTKTIGVIIPSFEIPFYATVISIIQNELAQKGYNIIICQSNEEQSQEKLNVETLLGSRVDGILLSLSKTTSDYSHLQKLYQSGTPLVLFNRVSQDKSFEQVKVNDYDGAKKLVKHLVSIGCQKIAHVSGPTDVLLSRERIAGYKDGLAECGRRFNSNWMPEGDFSVASGKQLTTLLLNLKEKPDAIFYACDAMAFGGTMAIKAKGLDIPKDIAIAGYTNEPLAAIVEPALTTIAQPFQQIGEVTVKKLLSLIEGKELKSSPEEIVLDTKLIIRASTVKK